MSEVPRPRRSNWRLAASPRSSLPTRLATIPSSPSRLVMYAKFAGAPPSWRPSGNLSQSNSPNPTVVNFFMDDPLFRGQDGILGTEALHGVLIRLSQPPGTRDPQR